MVDEYLEKLQEYLLNEKADLEQEINDLQTKLQENSEFAKIIEENDRAGYESFSPRNIHPEDTEKKKELSAQKKQLEEKIAGKQDSYQTCLERLQELTEVIDYSRKVAVENRNSDTKAKDYRLSLLEIQENERQRISRELHDSTVQNLTSLVHKVELCSKLVEMDPIRCKLELITMGKTLREIINETRQMIYNLRPMSFDDIGLDVTIEHALEKLESCEAKKIDFSVEGEPYEIKQVIGITLLRIIQEACSNAIKHANASYIKVVLNYQPGQILLTVKDDGDGFDVEKFNGSVKKDNSGFGLTMMKERIYLLAGDISIESKEKEGTKISVKVPIINKEE
jgi:two-component system sensor histidine kinase DegS